MKKVMSLFVCLFLAYPLLHLQAQNTTVPVSGTVTDEKGIPLAAVTVTALTGDKKVVSTTVTDASGVFKLNVSARVRSLQFSYTGLEEQLIAVSGKREFTVTLRAGSRNLSEVVVVGYGTQAKKDVTGSVASVKGAVISEKPVQSFESALAGRSAGVQITVPSGVVNEPPVFRVRGTNSISLSSYPLVVVDGVPSFTGDYSNPNGTELSNSSANPLASINPNDIESIDIAKDPAATAIYGSRAANGVVFITTKKGKPGRVRVVYDGWVGENIAYGLPQMMNADQYIAFKSTAVANNPALTGPSLVTFNYAQDAHGKNVNTDWYHYIYRHGYSQSHSLSLSGGNESTTYYLAGGYTSQEGIIKRNAFNRANILVNIDSRINKAITIGGKISYSDEQNLAAASSGSLPGEAYNTIGLGREGLVLPSILAPYLPTGSYNINGATIGYPNVTGTSIPFFNPVPILDLSRSNNEVNHIQSSVYAQIKPLSWVTLKSMYAIDNLLIDYDNFSTPITGDGFSTTGTATDTYGKYKTWLWDNTAQFDYTFGSNHNLSLLVGNEQQRRSSTGFGINRQTLSDPAYTYIQAGFTINNPPVGGMILGQNYLLSTFGRLTYNFNHKYYLMGTIREDQYSALGVKKGVFGGGSAGWEIAQEKFWTSAGLDHFFSSFRFRGSYGKVGNNAGIGDFTPYSLYGSGIYGGTATLSFPSGSVGNPNLKWETSLQTDVGFNFGILHDRVTGEFAYYNNNTNGLILYVSQAPSVGLPTNPPLNIGSMYNRGIEATVNATPVQKRNFSWYTSLNFTYNTNKVTALAPGLTAIQTGTGAAGAETVNQTKTGYSEGYLWVVRTAGVDPSTGKRIFLNSAGQKVYFQYQPPLGSGQSQWTSSADGTVKYVSPTGGSSITQAADGVMYKNCLPRYVGGWTNSFNYSGFTLDVLLTYQAGFYVFYGTNAGLHDQRVWNNETDMLTDAWSPKNPNTMKYAKPVFGDNTSNGTTIPVDINVFSGNFIKVRNVTLSYNLPARMLSTVKISNARVYVSGQNLGIITKYPGPDPEVSSNGNSNSGQGVDQNTVANARTFTVGLNVGF